MLDLNSFWFNQTLIVIVIQLVLFYYKLGIKMALHPGTFFAVIWLFSVFSQKLLMNFDLALIRDESSIAELNIFVLASSVFFSAWVLVFNEKSNNNNSSSIQIEMHFDLFKKMLAIMLVASVILMFYTWYSIGVSSLNLGHIRDLNTRDKENYFGTESNLFLSLLKYTQFFYIIAAIICGYLLGIKYFKNETIKLPTRYLYIPLFISLIYVLTNGGRNPIFIGVKLYLIGLFFALPKILTIQQKSWILKRILILALILTIFSTFISDTRSQYHNSETFSQNFDNPILANASGLIEYMGAHYYGYQLRNTDTFDENKLGYGFYTFNSIFNLKIPLSNYFNFDYNLGNFFGFTENNIDYFYLWQNEKEGYYTTNSVYLDLKLDFGFYGTIIFLMFFTLYTHKLFLKIIEKRSISVYTFFWFYLCYEFWAASNFKSSYATGLVGGVIMIILFNKVFIKKKINKYSLN
jgi:oligosaccharide repeat unit polymerase